MTTSAGRRIAIAAIVAVTCASHPQGQPADERFWSAGRYDRDHVIVYFAAGKFGDPDILPGSPKTPGTRIPPPLAPGFFEPRALNATEMAGFQRNRDAEPFAIGDRFEMLLGGGRTTPVTLTTNVGVLSDEGSGNDSYIGALARVEPSVPGFTGLYYIVRRVNDTASRPVSMPDRTGPAVGLRRQRVSAAITGRVVRLAGRHESPLNRKLGLATGGLNELVARAQQFTTADGLTRYFVAVKMNGAKGVCWLATIAAPNPVRILAEEERYCTAGDGQPPTILNVIDLGGGRTGIIADTSNAASVELHLEQYSEGAMLGRMPVLQQIAMRD